MEFILNLLEFNLRIPYHVIFLLIGLFFVLLWLSIIYFVFIDSKVYFPKTFPRLFFVSMTVAFGFGGLLMYLLYRGNAIDGGSICAENSFLQADVLMCPACVNIVPDGHRYCANCGVPVRRKCKSCGEFSSVQNKYCPFCGKKSPASKKSAISVTEICDRKRSLCPRKIVISTFKKLSVKIKNCILSVSKWQGLMIVRQLFSKANNRIDKEA